MRSQATLVLLLLAAAARAADTPAQDADSIGAAKKDLASLKSPTGQPDAAALLPTLDARDLGPTPGSQVIAMPSSLAPDKDASLDPTKKKEGTGNWLVDAMDKSSDRAKNAKGGKAGSQTDPDGLRAEDRLPGDKTDREAFLDDTEKEKSQAKDAPVSVYNPLDSFMGGWVSSRDRDLLLTAKGEVRADTGRTHDDLLPGLEGPGGGAVTDDLLPAASALALADAHAGPNPYIEAFEAAPVVSARTFTLQESAAFELPSQGTGGPASFGTGSEARPADAPRSFVPDFAQPSDDDKYFKQLKRF
jgi:hypothetical protein